MGSQIGSSAFGMAGHMLGGFLGGPIGGAIGGMAGGIIGSLLFGRKNKPMVPDVQLMNSAYGKPIPIVYGKMRLPANMIWQTDIETKEHSVGKGMGGQSAYSYFQSAALAFCEGPVDFLKLYLDGRLFVDQTVLYPVEQTKYKFMLRGYIGDETQVADPAMVQWVALHALPWNSCPDYHGLAYLTFIRPDLTHFGNRFPQVTCIVQSNPKHFTKFQQLVRYTTDYFIVAYLFSNGQSIAVDWVRGAVYTLMAPNGVSFMPVKGWGIATFNVYLGAQTQFADWDHIFFGGGLYPEGTGGVNAITCTQGGRIYGWSWSTGVIFSINPNTMVFDGEYTQVDLHGGWELSQLQGFELVTPIGSMEMLIGLIPGKGVVIINPLTRAQSGILPHRFTSSYATFWLSVAFAIGHQDTISGTVDIWYVVGHAGDPDQGTYIYKGVVNSSDPSGLEIWPWEEVGVLTPQDFGAPPGPVTTWQPGYDNVFYYDADDSIVVCLNSPFQAVCKFTNNVGAGWRLTGGTLGWYNPQADTSLGYLPVTGGGVFALIFAELDNTSLWENVDLGTGKITPSPVNYSGADATPNIMFAKSGQIEFSQSYGDFVLYQGWTDGEIHIAYLLRQATNRVKVGDIITDICGRVGVTPDMIDVTQIDSYETTGYCIQEAKSAGAAIADLLHVYQIDMVESDFRLKFLPRGLPVVASIPQSDLGSVDEKDPSQYWRVKEAQQQELPIQLVLRFQDPDLDFQSGATYAKRIELPVPTAWSKRRMNIDLPVIVNNTEARGIAEKWLYTMWAERDTVETVLPWKYLFLDPADNVNVLLDNGDFNVIRIEEQNIGADLSIRVHGAFEDLNVYNPAPHLLGAITGFQQQIVQAAPFAEFLQWNTPLLQDADDTGGASMRIYYAAGAYTNGWVSGELWRSVDNSATWEDFSGVPTAAAWGHSITRLGDTPSRFATDTVNTVTIQLISGATLLSCTYDQMLSGANAGLLAGEVIQFQTVTHNDDGTVTLSNILRGRRGTEYACAVHAIGDVFVSLVLGTIGGRTLSLPERNTQELWKLVPTGRVMDQTPTDAFTYRGYDLMPYAPVFAKRTPSGADLLLSWTRRTRLAGLLMDGTDTAPLAETSEAYEVYLLTSVADVPGFNPDNPASYKRAFTGLAAPNVLYTAAMMTVDGWDPTQTLFPVIYQLSGVIGRGFPGTFTLPAK
jgi:hypothetical protein